MAEARVDILLALRSKVTGVDGIIGSLGRVAKAAVLAGAAMAVFAAKQGIDQSSQFVAAAQRTQTSIEAIQVFGRAAEDADASLADVEKTLINVARNTEDAARGNAKLAASFGNLGLSARGLRDLAPEQQLEAVAVAVNRLGGSQAALNDAAEILGAKNMPKLLEVMQRLGREGYAGLRAEIERTHGLISDETALKLEEAGDRLTQLKNRFTVFAAESVVALAPLMGALERLAGWAVDVISSIQDFMQHVGASAANVVNWVQGLPKGDLGSSSPASPSSAAKPSRPGVSQQERDEAELRTLQFQLAARRSDIERLDSDPKQTGFEKRTQRLELLAIELELLEQINEVQMRLEGGPKGLSDVGGFDVRPDISPEDLKTFEEQTKRLDEINQLRDAIFGIRMEFFDLEGSLSQGIGGAIQGLINGTMTWGDAFRHIGGTLVNSVINAFANMAADFLAKRTMMFLFGRKIDAAEVAASGAKNAALAAQTTAKAATETAVLTPPATLASISSFGLAAALGVAALAAILAGSREYGGPVMGGRPYLVGERRPEIFVPSVSGRIVPSLSAFSAEQRGMASAGGSGSGPIGASRQTLEQNFILSLDPARLFRLQESYVDARIIDLLEKNGLFTRTAL